MLDEKGSRPEIKTPEAAELVGRMVTDLYAKWLAMEQEAKTLAEEMKTMAATFAAERHSLEQQIRERDIRIDDLSQREHALDEKLRLEIIEGEAMRGEIRHLRTVANAAADRVEAAVMRDMEYRHAEASRPGPGKPADVDAIVEELGKLAARNEEATPRLHMQPTRLPPEFIDGAEGGHENEPHA